MTGLVIEGDEEATEVNFQLAPGERKVIKLVVAGDGGWSLGYTTSYSLSG